MSLNRLRDLFQAGKGAIGTFVSMGNESLVECLGYTGLDFVIIDTEHGPFDTETMMNREFDTCKRKKVPRSQ